MKSNMVHGLVSGVIFFIAASVSGSVFADYYVVPAMGVYTPPPTVIYYEKQCTVTKHKKYKHHYKTAKHYKKNSAVLSVYYVVNNPCGPCGGCNGCRQVLVPVVSSGYGYQVLYGQTSTMTHREYHQLENDNYDYYGPDIDGNTYDNDIYY
jgi:hypothetical protein